MFNQTSTKDDLIATDGQTLRNYQNERDFITRNLVKVIEFQNNELTAIEKEIERMQALTCIMRRLVNIVYGMLKNHNEYRMPELPKEKAM